MAKRFKFKLDPVLNYRENIEKDKLLDFSRSQAKAIEKKQQIEKMDTAKVENQEMIAQLYSEKADIHNIVDVYRHINSIEIQKAHEQQALVATEFEMEQKRKVYLEARKKRRALDLLKEKRQEEHRKEEDRQESLQLDDLAITRIRVKPDAEGDDVDG